MKLVTALFVALCCNIFPSVFQVHGFNLEPRIPIIKIGPTSSHFGYSVAQHKATLSGTSPNIKYESWILVGAPKGENLQPGTKRSGALFKCPLTSYANDCQQVQTDGLKNSNGLYKGSPDGSLLGPAEDEIKDDQWMGVTLKSQGEGGDILVCGHRYQHKGIGEQNFRWGYGLCYRLKNNFEYEDIYQPCMGKPVDLEHEQFGYCQAGTSGLLLEDEVVLGIPGTYTWRGTVHTRNISDDYLFRDKTHYFGVYTDDDSPVDKYSYLGYSVTAGRFFGNKLSYVAGAPRSRGTGQVIFFSRDRIGNPIMNFDLILNGEMFASSFGFEVIAMDINNDGRDDLVVSAPFYFTKQSSGAVYVFLNEGRKGISNKTPFSRLEGAPGESRFGFSMTSLGDLNLDGFNDLAVGAPYEDRGVIYIFLGSKDGIVKKPSQVIRAQDLPGLPYDAFGYALSGGMDLDNNNYNDLLTSSFCSDRVVLLRARPIIDIQTRVDSEYLRNINPTKPGCPEDPTSSETCFAFNACFKMMNEAGTQTYLSLQYNISERFYNDQLTNRIRFHRSRQDRQSTIEQIINLRPQNMGKFQCSREIVYLKEGQRDVLRPVRFKLSYKIHQLDPKPVGAGEPLPDINDYPILNQKEAVRYFEANFAKDCGSDEICESDLNIAANIDLERHSLEDHYVFELGRRQFFTMNIVVSNNGEPAYLPNLYVSHDQAIDMSIRESETGLYQCFPVQSGLLHCNLDNPLVNATQPIKLVFKSSGLPFKSKYIDLVAWVNSTSEEVYHRDNRVKFILEVKRRAEISITGSGAPEQVFYSGEVVGESAIENIDQVGSKVLHKYLIDNRGPWKVDEMKVLIHWPYQVENNKKEGKWLLYLTDIPFVEEGKGECDVDPEYVNSLGLSRKVFVQSEFDTSFIAGHQVGQRPSTRAPPGKDPSMTITSSKNRTVIKQTVSSSSVIDHLGGRSSSSYDKREGSGLTGTWDDRSSSRTTTESSRFDSRRNFASGGERNRHQLAHGEFSNSRSDFDSEGRDLNKVFNIRTVKDGDGTFVNGYNEAGRLVWSSRSSNNGLSSSRTVVSYDSHNEIGDGSYIDAERRNERLLTRKMKSIADFRILRDGEESWVNGYDKWGNLVWSSRPSFSSKSGGQHSGNDYDVTVRKKYSKFDRTGTDGGTESRREWSTVKKNRYGTEHQSGSSFTDRYGTKTTWGSSEPDDIWNGNQRESIWDKDGFESTRDFEMQHRSSRFPQNDEPKLHGFNYSRAVVDPVSGDAKVITRRIFSRTSVDTWEAIHSPSQQKEHSSSVGKELRRSKREREFVVKSEAITDATGKTVEVVSFTCDGRIPTAKCFTFECTIRDLAADQTARILIASRLWNATLIEDYSRVSFVSIKSKGELVLPKEIQLDQDPSDDVAYAETLAYSNLLEQLPAGQVPWWVILISVLAGILLLFLIAYGLWRMGFFKRRRPDPTYSGNINRRHANGYN